MATRLRPERATERAGTAVTLALRPGSEEARPVPGCRRAQSHAPTHGRAVP